MKKIFAALTAMAMLCTLSACKKAEPPLVDLPPQTAQEQEAPPALPEAQTDPAPVTESDEVLEPKSDAELEAEANGDLYGDTDFVEPNGNILHLDISDFETPFDYDIYHYLILDPQLSTEDKIKSDEATMLCRYSYQLAAAILNTGSPDYDRTPLPFWRTSSVEETEQSAAEANCSTTLTGFQIAGIAQFDDRTVHIMSAVRAEGMWLGIEDEYLFVSDVYYQEDEAGWYVVEENTSVVGEADLVKLFWADNYTALDVWRDEQSRFYVAPSE